MKKVFILILLFSSLLSTQTIGPGGGGGGGGGSGSFTTTTYNAGGTTTFAIATASAAKTKITLTHSTSTTLAITGPANGGDYTILLIQDGTGGGTAVTLGSGCTWKVGGGGAGAIAPSASANAIDSLAFTYDGTNCIANFRQNYN